MTHTDQTGHRQNIATLPSSPTRLQTKTQALGLALHLAATNGTTCTETFRIVQATNLLDKISEQAFRGRPPSLSLRLVFNRQQLTHPLADPRPTRTQQQ